MKIGLILPALLIVAFWPQPGDPPPSRTVNGSSRASQSFDF